MSDPQLLVNGIHLVFSTYEGDDRLRLVWVHDGRVFELGVELDDEQIDRLHSTLRLGDLVTVERS